MKNYRVLFILRHIVKIFNYTLFTIAIIVGSLFIYARISKNPVSLNFIAPIIKIVWMNKENDRFNFESLGFLYDTDSKSYKVILKKFDFFDSSNYKSTSLTIDHLEAKIIIDHTNLDNYYLRSITANDINFLQNIQSDNPQKETKKDKNNNIDNKSVLKKFKDIIDKSENIFKRFSRVETIDITNINFNQYIKDENYITLNNGTLKIKTKDDIPDIDISIDFKSGDKNYLFEGFNEISPDGKDYEIILSTKNIDVESAFNLIGIDKRYTGYIKNSNLTSDFMVTFNYNYKEKSLVDIKTEFKISQGNLSLDGTNGIYQNGSSMLMTTNANSGESYYEINIGIANNIPIFIDKFDESYLLEPVKINGKYISNNNEITIDKLITKINNKNFSLNSSFIFSENNLDMGIYAEINDVPINDLGMFWPKTAAPTVWEWCTSKIKEGLIPKATFEAKFTLDNQNKFKIINLGGEINIDGATVTYLPKTPSVTNIKALAKYSTTYFNIDILSGKTLDANITSGKVNFNEFDKPASKMTIEANITDSSIKTIKDIIQSPDIKLLSPDSIIYYTSDGKINGVYKMEMPLKDNVNSNDITFLTSGSAKEVTINNYLSFINAKNGELDFYFDNNGGTIDGKAYVKNSLFDFDYKYISPKVITKNENNVTLNIFSQASPNVLEEITPEILNPILKYDSYTGIMPINFNLLGKNDNYNWKAEIDTSKAIIKIPVFMIEQNNIPNAKIIGKGNIKDGVSEINFNLLNNNQNILTAKANIDNNSFSYSILSKIKNRDFIIDLSSDNKKININVKADNLNAIDILDDTNGTNVNETINNNDKTSNAPNIPQTKIKIDNIPRVFYGIDSEKRININFYAKNIQVQKDSYMTDVKSIIENYKGRIYRLDLSGKIDQAPFDLSIFDSTTKNYVIEFNTANFDRILKVFRKGNMVEGGDLNFIGIAHEGNLLNISGSILMRNMTAFHDSWFIEFLSGLHFPSLFSKYSTKKFKFEQITGDIHYIDNFLIFKNTYYDSPSLGGMFNGYYNMASHGYKFEGTIIPLNGVTRALSYFLTPWIKGTNLSRGLITFDWKVTGTSNNFSVTVDPISYLFPLFLGQIYSGFKDYYTEDITDIDKINLENRKEIIDKEQKDSKK